MANAKMLHLEPNATYIPDTNMLVSFALGDAKVWRWGFKPTPVPNANGFASQWNIICTATMHLTCKSHLMLDFFPDVCLYVGVANVPPTPQSSFQTASR